ncbi:MAG: NAD(P)/FAD-dependent oxidoreductase [Pseudomonadales bacterium]|nr:NAD(P)/FAD-dependent oxidoreductase [Pseudomonadales bacterium]
MPSPKNHASLKHKVIIIGTGFGGLGMAVKLKEAGIDDFLMLEKAKDVGGCWRENSYPGAACDVPSHLYSFSFEKNANWSRKYAPQSEIYNYLKHCAQKYGLLQHIRFSTELTSAVFNDQEGCWNIETAQGQHYTTKTLITACGQLSQPAFPKIKGIETFKGKKMHSALWDESYSLKGKRIAVIGTGASAIQFIPELAKHAAHLTVFQRSAAYVIPKDDRPYGLVERQLFKALPGTQELSRQQIYLKLESNALAFSWAKPLMRKAEREFEKLLKKSVKDTALRKKLTPDYPMGCKRILLSNEYFETFTRPNVSLITENIKEVTSDSIILKDGSSHQVDAIVYGTGFRATEFLSPLKIKRENGADLNTSWNDGAEAYLGINVSGFPNFHMLYGPNTNLGHNSIVYMLESQINYILKTLEVMDKKGIKSLNVKKHIQNDFNRRLQEKVKTTVWNQNCDSWYKTESGKNTNNWPGFTFIYRLLTTRVNLGQYEVKM